MYLLIGEDIDHGYEDFLDTFTLRECVEKLELLKTPEERRRRLLAIPEVRADPNMDPNYESEEDAGASDFKKQGVQHCVFSHSFPTYC